MLTGGPVGLRARLILIVTLGLGVSLAASLGIVLRTEEATERVESSTRAAALLSALAPPMSVLLTQGRVADIDNLMGDLQKRAQTLGFTRIVLVDGHGVVIAETGTGSFGADLARLDPFVATAVASPRALQDPPAPRWPLRVSVPVQAGVRWATLLGTLDQEQIQREIVGRRWRLIVSALAVSSAGLLVLLLLLSVEVLWPLDNILKTARRLAGGDWGARAQPRGAAELQVLAHTLNDAAHQLSGTKDALEAEVARRTEELSRANERLEKLALTDPLTGLFNRRYLDQTLALEITRQRRAGRPFSVLMLDLDNFKHYNDTHGHPRGDELLRRLARILTDNLRGSDVVARVGGEEFLVLLFDTSLDAALTAGEKLRAAVADFPFAFGEEQPLGRVTVSVGVAGWPAHGDHVDGVLDAADQALYVSKAQGRNRVTLASHDAHKADA
ncbi:MAG: diguanylate cyclase [Deltaproteobacteria bacterium]|nr:diguanylate cyclase [Deltaproteobacteria bacterium]